MAENVKSARKPRASRAKAPAPTPGQPEAAPAVVQSAEAMAAATTENNPASTTRANDPARDTEEAAKAAAAASGTNDPANNPAPAPAEGEEGFIPPADEEHPLEDAAAGNRHSHPARTQAEATLAAQTANAAPTVGDGAALPAGDDADPAVAGLTDGEAAGDTEVLKSPHDESGAIQDATRAAIGAGAGAPDGVGDVGEDPSAGEVVAPLEVAPGVTFVGGKAKLWPLLEAGATNEELIAASGHRSVLGTIHLMARQAGREIEQVKDKKTGIKTYKLSAAPEPKKAAARTKSKG